MSEDAHGIGWRCACGAMVYGRADCPFCELRKSRNRPPSLCPALNEAAWRTANLHLCLAHSKVSQARELLAMTGEAARLAAQLENVATWLDDTAIRATARRAEEVRL